MRTEFDRAAASAAEAEERIAPMRARLARARETEAATRTAFSEAERAAQRLETEARTLRKLLTSGTRDLWPSVLDALTVERGLETALGAALGDDLEASVEPSAPIHWRQTDATGDCALPEGATPLSELVSGPPALRRRLAQIGLVDRAGGAALGLALRPGQMLVSREGDLWRWDGYVAAAEAPTAAARRLAEKNRLADVEGAFEAASRVVEDHRRRAEAARKGVADASVEEAAAIDTARLERRALETVRARLQEAEQRVAEFARRVATLEGSHQRLSAEIADAAARATTARADIAALPGTDSLERELALASDEAARCRADEGEARAGLDALRREASARQRRLDAIAAEMAAWEQRRSRAQAQIESFDSRSAGITGELASLEAAPAAFAEQRRALTHEIEAAQARARARSDALSVGEAALVEADRAARAALEALSATRERRARSEERVSAAGARLGLLVESIAENFETDAAGLAALAGMAGGLELPAGESVERALNRLKEERERIGSVNLQADEELKALGDEKERLEADRNDLAEAIRRLRQAIQNLNRQGRERLSEAFSVVNGHFQALFTELFGGGTAELQFVESDDPLMAGLEIVARPPGKKPQTLSLLSGGEQTLTAIALIFAVFLTNPAPICVLDEVDAPLDDSNVERFCDLVHHICERTGTRFLVITHNPITMARMDRLFGVTMPERGASQIVSVDLETAERFRDAV